MGNRDRVRSITRINNHFFEIVLIGMTVSGRGNFANPRRFTQTAQLFLLFLDVKLQTWTAHLRASAPRRDTVPDRKNRSYGVPIAVFCGSDTML